MKVKQLIFKVVSIAYSYYIYRLFFYIQSKLKSVILSGILSGIDDK